MRLAAPIVEGAALLLAVTACHAGQIVVDHSFGPGGPLSGPNYTIPDTGGKKVGNNLFHSFSQFNLAAGDVATFTGPVNIHNVIARVTGGSASAIDGTIQCDIAGANFFLINPFGVMFGPNAQVNVSGSFAVTTADYVKLADGGRFDARNPAQDVLTAAPVSAFGFLGPTVAPIVMQGPSADTPTPVMAQLADGQSFFIVGGDMHLDNVQINAPSGRVALISVGSAGEVGADVVNLRSSIDTSSFAQLGNIALTAGATLDVSGDPGGRIEIQGQNATLASSYLGATSFGSQDGLGIDFSIRDTITLQNGTSIYVDAYDVGAAGDLSMTAKSILLLGKVGTGGNAVNVLAVTIGAGNAGNITIHTDTLVLQDGAIVIADTAGDGDGGNISIQAKSIVMDGQHSSALLSSTSSQGKAGNISIQTDSLTLKADAGIQAEAFGPSPAGTIQIKAGRITIDRAGSVGTGYDGISVDSKTTGFTSGLRAGDIVIDVGELDLYNRARISSASATDSPGGDIFINAAHGIRLADSEITTQAGGEGGSVHLTVSALVYLSDSRITAQSLNGNGGNVTINAQSVILNNSSLAASAVARNGGNVNIDSGLFLRFDSVIDVSSKFGLQGTVTLPPSDANLTGSLLPLAVEPIRAETLLRPDCGVRLPVGASSFVLLGRGGVPTEPDGLLAASPSSDGN